MDWEYRVSDKRSQEKKIIKNKQISYLSKFLVILFPAVIVPIISYDFLIFYFKHNTVIYSSIIFGVMVGIVLLYFGEKFPKNLFRKLPF